VPRSSLVKCFWSPLGSCAVPIETSRIRSARAAGGMFTWLGKISSKSQLVHGWFVFASTLLIIAHNSIELLLHVSSCTTKVLPIQPLVMMCGQHSKLSSLHDQRSNRVKFGLAAAESRWAAGLKSRNVFSNIWVNSLNWRNRLIWSAALYCHVASYSHELQSPGWRSAQAALTGVCVCGRRTCNGRSGRALQSPLFSSTG
jgi:hypothetical protein